LAREISQTRGLRFDGLMGYEGHTLLIADRAEKEKAISTSLARLIGTKEQVEAAGLPCRIVSAGGTGSYQFTADVPGVTEVQAGGGVFACRYYTQACGVTGHRPAIQVLATVVSRPTPERAILDIGQKSISEYRTPAVIPAVPGSRILALSAVHATVEVPDATVLAIGEKVGVIPGYSDFTFVLHDRVIGTRAGRVEAVWPLLGRGMLQ
jgi:D-serine deaminase-like pyridoxal phosphate-dependent protein